MRVVKLSRIIYEDARLFHKQGETPLMQAAKRADIQAVSELLAQSAKVNAKDEEGSTALLYAQSPTHSLDAITSLVISAPVSALNAFNEPFNDLAKVMQVLIEHGAEVNTANRRGDTALMRAAAAMNPRAVFALLDGGAQVDAVDTNGNTALMRALLPIADTSSLKIWSSIDEKRKYAMSQVARDLILAKLLPIVRALIEKGASLNAKNKQGETALILATRIGEHLGHRELARLLQPSGAQTKSMEKAAKPVYQQPNFFAGSNSPSAVIASTRIMMNKR
jgi:ankyrin repeat protein